MKGTGYPKAPTWSRPGGLPDDVCPCPHWCYMLEGRLAMKTRAGEELYQAGQVFYWPAGHAPRALEVIRHLSGGG